MLRAPLLGLTNTQLGLPNSLGQKVYSKVVLLQRFCEMKSVAASTLSQAHEYSKVCVQSDYFLGNSVVSIVRIFLSFGNPE